MNSIRMKESEICGESVPTQSVEGWIIFVTGIHEAAKESDIFEIFAEFGEIQNLHLNLDRQSGFVKGYALVEYKKKDQAAQARCDMNGKEILGHKISVDWAFIQSL
eukprot:gnl/MRDRNA2_/MRDRNA2_86901_c0_seq1.p1 gnl/MRDRNA2_/MRDRNA2_86901_c0~~gnl/MRDRNA2_/MRDRNA2_86901_c0_seq1.p1  ORF type:complete len:106 (+),score=20.13 gnl/MRDRNA2_/MRDRNA2_86901_c0_seq1:66-383(+)